MLVFKLSSGIQNMVAINEPLYITLITWPRVYMLVLYPSARRPKIFFPVGYSPMSVPFPPADKNGKLQWDKHERVDFRQKTKEYFGKMYGKTFAINSEWLIVAVKDNKDLRIELNANGEISKIA